MEDEGHLKPDRKSDRLSLLISVIMHLVIGVLLVSFGVFSSSPKSLVEADRPGGIVLTEVNANEQTEYIDQNDAKESRQRFLLFCGRFERSGVQASCRAPNSIYQTR